MGKFKGTITTQRYSSEGTLLRQFQPNIFWQMLKSYFGLDVQIPLLTGLRAKEVKIRNNLSSAGLARIVARLGNVGATDPIVAAALGIGTPAANALGNEAIRGATTNSVVTTAVTNDTLRCVATFNFASTSTITESGLFDDLSSGDMIAYKSLPSTVMESGDIYIYTHDIQAVND